MKKLAFVLVILVSVSFLGCNYGKYNTPVKAMKAAAYAAKTQNVKLFRQVATMDALALYEENLDGLWTALEGRDLMFTKDRKVYTEQYHAYCKMDVYTTYVYKDYDANAYIQVRTECKKCEIPDINYVYEKELMRETGCKVREINFSFDRDDTFEE